VAKVRRTPEGLAEAIKGAGFKVERRNHGWLCYPTALNPDGTKKPAEWISRNTGGRGQRNNEAVARRFGIL
jgi:hypothetical protein